MLALQLQGLARLSGARLLQGDSLAVALAKKFLDSYQADIAIRESILRVCDSSLNYD